MTARPTGETAGLSTDVFMVGFAVALLAVAVDLALFLLNVRGYRDNRFEWMEHYYRLSIGPVARIVLMAIFTLAWVLLVIVFVASVTRQ